MTLRRTRMKEIRSSLRKANTKTRRLSNTCTSSYFRHLIIVPPTSFYTLFLFSTISYTPCLLRRIWPSYMISCVTGYFHSWNNFINSLLHNRIMTPIWTSDVKFDQSLLKKLIFKLRRAIGDIVFWIRYFEFYVCDFCVLLLSRNSIWEGWAIIATIVGIWTCMRRQGFMLRWVEQKLSFITSAPGAIN